MQAVCHDITALMAMARRQPEPNPIENFESALPAHPGGAGSRRFVTFHLLVPGGWTVQAGHDLCDQLEREIAAALTHTDVLTHLEPIEDPKAWDDQGFRWEEG